MNVLVTVLRSVERGGAANRQLRVTDGVHDRRIEDYDVDCKWRTLQPERRAVTNEKCVSLTDAFRPWLCL